MSFPAVLVFGPEGQQRGHSDPPLTPPDFLPPFFFFYFAAIICLPLLPLLTSSSLRTGWSSMPGKSTLIAYVL